MLVFIWFDKPQFATQIIKERQNKKYDTIRWL